MSSNVAGSAVQWLGGVLATLLPALDIVNEPVNEREPPRWAVVRGWSEFLLGLTERELLRCEALGLSACADDLANCPASLRELAAAVRRCTQVPTLNAHATLLSTRAIGVRKQRQLEPLLAAVEPMAQHAARIVDVGAGRGHLARLSADHFGRSVLAIERDPERTDAAERLLRYSTSAARVTVRAAAVGDEGLDLRPDDFAIGLHACGRLGDQLVEGARDSGCDLTLVSCCLQKIPGAVREPLSKTCAELRLAKDVLGLTNLTIRAQGVETTLPHILRARQNRVALRSLLLARGEQVSPGAEMRAINRRRANGSFEQLAEHALHVRQLAAASRAELEFHERQATASYARMRRLNLPRALLARITELAVVLDRGAALEEAGRAVVVAAAFSDAVSPRNLALFASTGADRLPTPLSVHGSG